jgi:hypothetical protein
MRHRRQPFNPSKFADMLDENFYATGPKGENLKSERERVVALLSKKGNTSSAYLNLANKLAACKRQRRCRSAACPECAAAGQRLEKFLKAQAGGMTIVCVTVVPQDGMVKLGKLNKADHERAIRRWRDKLGKAGITWFVGATDISLNEHRQARHKPKWSEHFYGVTVTKDPKELKRALKKIFPQNQGHSPPR